MAPTNRFDEAGDDDGVSRQTHERRTVKMNTGPRLSPVVHDASRWGSTARPRGGTPYLGIPQNPSYRRRQSHPDAQASRSRGSPDIENPAHGAALSDMGPPAQLNPVP